MRKVLSSFWEVIQTIAVALIVVFIVRTFIAQPFLVSGASMEPNFNNGNYLLIDELTYRFREPQRGEVIVFRYPGDRKSYYIKRIIALGGERVVIDKEGVTVYFSDSTSQKLEEPYIRDHVSGIMVDTTLGADEYFVMGDNRGFSFDSRSWGSLNRKEIIGLARLRLWPINQIAAFVAPTY